MSINISKINSIVYVLIFIFSVLDSTIASIYFTLFDVLSILLLSLIIILNFTSSKSDYFSLCFIIPSIFFCLLSVLASNDLHLGGYNTAIVVILMLISFGFYGVSFDFKLLNTIFLVFTYSLLIVSIYFIQNNLSVVFSLDKRSGLFLNSNPFGMFISFFLMYQFLFLKSAKLKTLNLIITLPFLIFSNSRGALFSFIIFYLIYLIYQSKSLNRLIFRFVLILFYLVLFLTVFNLFFSEISEQLLNKVQKSGTTGRIDLWLFVIDKLFSDLIYFIFGSGPATTVLDGKSAHNSYLNEMLNMGFFFVMSYMSLLSYKFYLFKKVNYRPFICAIIPVLFLGFFESILFSNSIFWFFILFINLSFSKINQHSI